jgi:hypothetical protein
MTWSCRLETFSTGDGSSGSMATRRGLAGRAALHWWHSSRLQRGLQEEGGSTIAACCSRLTRSAPRVCLPQFS